MAPLYLCLALSAMVLALILRLRTTRSKLPLPPGPRKLPLVGNLFDLPSAFEWKAYMEWSREYDSDVIHLDLAGQSLIVLSSAKATDDLLEKRSSMYSDRSSFPMLVDLMGWDFNLSLMKYGTNLIHLGTLNKLLMPYCLHLGAMWRTHRRLFNQAFSQTAAKKFHPTELKAAHGLLRRLLHGPEDFRQHIRQMAGETIMSLTYGIDVLPAHDPYISLAEEAVNSAAVATIPGKFLVDSIPMLKHIPDWFPGAGFKRRAREWRKLSRRVQEVPFNEVKHQISSGTTPYSFAAQCLENLSESKDAYYTEETVQRTAAVVYIAGSDTIITVLSTFVLAMLANPEAQKKAQAEIDSVTGQTRLPDFNDQDALPYVSALVKEVLRWRPATPIGVPHFLPVEDEYRGFRIPANSIVIGNAWAILQDEAMYPDPLAFKPERFLLDGKPNPHVREPQAVFGFGRRICPGRHMAAESVWMSVASILAALDITKAVAEDGQVIEPTYEYLSELISAPAPFKCSIRPRSRDLAALVEATVN
ncbi:cytochrome P450 [Mycena alexandri]|uniref:Cytochrome P450 n=1 Tax=Mycena alexandri TaxID=1745969 RepID=A0AAD6SR17_9AGAR|nr:cytochrome P450 [Mycena alexandri]